MRTLAKELGPKGTTVNGIMPGIIRTDKIIQLAHDRAKREGKTVKEVLHEYAKPIPLERLGEPEEISYLVALLASEFFSRRWKVELGVLRSALQYAFLEYNTLLKNFYCLGGIS